MFSGIWLNENVNKILAHSYIVSKNSRFEPRKMQIKQNHLVGYLGQTGN